MTPADPPPADRPAAPKRKPASAGRVRAKAPVPEAIEAPAKDEPAAPGSPQGSVPAGDSADAAGGSGRGRPKPGGSAATGRAVPVADAAEPGSPTHVDGAPLADPAQPEPGGPALVGKARVTGDPAEPGSLPSAGEAPGTPSPAVPAWGGSAPVPEALAGGPAGPEALAPYVAEVLAALRAGAEARGGPLPEGGPSGVAELLRGLLAPDALLPEDGDPAALGELSRALAATAADPADPGCAAHLLVPPLAVAAAADLAVAALNPSLDSWDQAPGGTEIEAAVLRVLAQLVGFEEPEAASGVFTTGGTESNLMALLLARDAVLAQEFGVRPGGGLPAEAAGRLRFFCSAAAHFSVARAAAVLGLGTQAVVAVETTDDGALDPRLLDWSLADARTAGHVPCCVVATAGTTDLGAIDPLRSVAAVAARHGVRLHADAAYGGGALFSRTLAPLLDGLELADTVGLDLHKLGWQPVAAGVLLVREAGMLSPLEQRVAYLNPADDQDAGYTSLLGRSLRTTRRPDAFKVAVTLRTLGRAGLGALVDRCHALARHAARAVAAQPRLELVAEPTLTTVLFRYLPDAAHDADLVNAELRRRLLASGTAVVGRTELPGPEGGVRLKLTLLNPHATEADLDRLLALVVAAGAAVDEGLPARPRTAPGVSHEHDEIQEKPA